MTSSEPPAAVSLSDPGDLIAATPVLLGFVPRSSLVAMALGGASGRRLGLTVRADLPPPEHIAGVAERVVEGILHDRPAAVVVIVVGPGGDAGPPAVELVEQVELGLAAHAVEACHTLWTESTTPGSRWQCYGECGCTGLVSASDSPLAAAARAEGRVVRADRSELDRLVAPVDEQVLRRREALLAAAVDAEAEATFAALSSGGGDLAPASAPATGAVSGALTTAATPGPADAPAAVGPAETFAPAAAASIAAPTAAAPDARSRVEGGAGSGEDAWVVGAPGAGRRAGERAAGERWIDPRTEVIEGIAVLDAALDVAQEALVAARAGTADPGQNALDGAALGGGSPIAGGDEWLDDEMVVALTRALQVPLVRDAAVAACTGSRPEAAEALWAALVRGTPDPEAAEPATLLALVGLLRGDGALANVALQRAEAAWPGHSFAATLRGVAAAGIRPSELRACLAGAPVAHPGPHRSPRRGPHRSKATGRRRRRAPRPTRRRRRSR